MHDPILKQSAEKLFRDGNPIDEIAAQLSVSRNTIASWKRRHGWDLTDSAGRIRAAIADHAEQILAMPVEERTQKHWDALDRYVDYIEKLDKKTRPPAPNYSIPFPEDHGGHYPEAEKQQADPVKQQAKKKKGRPKAGSKNVIDAEMVALLFEEFEKICFGYQWEWWVQRDKEGRLILKSRQIGATYYFALEALIIAITTGKNQIFVSASKKQAASFRRYIVAFVSRVCDLELQGDPMRLILPDHEKGECFLYFLGTQVSSVQGYTGDLYLDEAGWVRNFHDIQEVASAMALQDGYRETYFTTPSTMDHDFYKFWSGQTFNKERPKEDQITIDISHAALKDGADSGDGFWRQIVTLKDAIAKGCKLITEEKARRKYSPARYAMLCGCQFTDHTKGVFSFKQLHAALVDAVDKWDDFDPISYRKLGNLPVWIGYDPSGEGEDAAAIVVVAPPSAHSDHYRVVEVIRMDDSDYDEQAEQIEELCKQYNVEFIGIDNQGCGDGVYQQISKLFPDITEAIRYSPESKASMVVKAQALLRRALLKIDSVYLDDVLPAMLAIQRSSTRSGEAMTYTAKRDNDVGHADVAWALLHAIGHAEFENLLDVSSDPAADDGLGMEIFN